MFHWTKLAPSIIVVASIGILLRKAPVDLLSFQQTTSSIPTSSGTSLSPFITVTYSDGANVRAGPSSYDYPTLGPKLLPGDQATALGRSPGGDWIEIAYPGSPDGTAWVYAALVSLSGGSLPIIAPPPTATPLTTPTINQTMLAAFPTPVMPVNLSTFTPPPRLQMPTFTANSKSSSGVPAVFIFLGLLTMGLLGIMISFHHRE